LLSWKNCSSVCKIRFCWSMANKYEDQARESRRIRMMELGCSNKKAFNTKAQAKKTSRLDVYLCRFCKKWHRTGNVGRTVKMLRKSKKRKPKRL